MIGLVSCIKRKSYKTEIKMKTERWTYSVYRSTLKLDGCTVAILTPDGKNSFGNGQVQPILDALNNSPESTYQFERNNPIKILIDKI